MDIWKGYRPDETESEYSRRLWRQTLKEIKDGLQTKKDEQEEITKGIQERSKERS